MYVFVLEIVRTVFCVISLFVYLPLQGRPLAVLCLQGFSDLLLTAVVRWDETDTFLTAVNPSIEDSEEASTAERIHFFIRHFQVRSICISLSLNNKLTLPLSCMHGYKTPIAKYKTQ